MLELLRTTYMDKVYFLLLHVVLHLGEEKEGDAATSFDLDPPARVSWRRRRLLSDKEPEEKEEKFTMSHSPR